MNQVNTSVKPIINLPLPLASLPQPVYIVGGAVRDRLLGLVRQPLDLDLVVETGVMELGRRLAQQLAAGFVVLDAERQIVRLVQADFTLDIAQQVGPSIEADLHQRDFTCNAIAIELYQQHWHDPLSGAADIERRQLRMVNPANLDADRLRVIRGYRQAAQLGFVIEPATAAALTARAGGLAALAGERVRSELHYLLSYPTLLAQSVRAGIWQHWLPQVSEQALAALARPWHWAQQPEMTRVLAAERTVREATALALLLQADPTPEATLTHLRYSRAEIQWVSKTLRSWPLLQQLLAQPASRGEIWQFFQAVQPCFSSLVAIAISAGIPEAALEPYMQRWQDPHDPLAHPQPLLDGQVLMQTLKLRPSPLIGTLLEALNYAQAEGTIQTQAEALELARQQLKQQS